MAKQVYIYRLTPMEAITRQESLTIPDGTPVRLSKPPAGGVGLSSRFKWIETLDGEFLGMTTSNALEKAP